MRELTKKQKNYLDKWFIKHKQDLSIFNVMDVMSPDEFATLQRMNDTEVLYQNIENYITDKI
jgi:hypothetical protein